MMPIARSTGHLLHDTVDNIMTPRNVPGRRLLIGIAVRVLPSLGRLVRQRDELRQQIARLRDQNDTLQRRNTSLRAELQETRAELPHARDSDGGNDPQFLFIVTYGRSGSTLLQGIITSIPGYLIRGENGGVAYHLYKFHTIAERRRRSSPGWRNPHNAWFGIGGYPTRLALTELRRLLITTVIRPERDSRVVGYKEIKWHQEDLDAYVSFLRAVFPGARFVINTRNLDDVALSKWWARKTNAREVLANTEARMLALKTRLGDDAYHIHYDDYVHDPGRLRGLFDWLGEEFDESRIKEVMNKKHSY